MAFAASNWTTEMKKIHKTTSDNVSLIIFLIKTFITISAKNILQYITERETKTEKCMLYLTYYRSKHRGHLYLAEAAWQIMQAAIFIWPGSFHSPSLLFGCGVFFSPHKTCLFSLILLFVFFYVHGIGSVSYKRSRWSKTNFRPVRLENCHACASFKVLNIHTHRMNCRTVLVLTTFNFNEFKINWTTMHECMIDQLSEN